MSEDRVLLERAAKAAGIEVHGNVLRRDGTWGLYVGDGEIGCWDVWNPLLDDGDAFRLAVKLGLHVFCPDAEPVAVARFYPWDDKSRAAVRVFEADGDPAAATRRAVVRAAAALGDQT